MIPRHRRISLGLAIPLTAFLLTGLASNEARAQLTDPADLHIGGTVPTQGGDPNHTGNTGLVNIYQNNGGTNLPDLNKPFLLILAIANDTSGGTYFGLNTTPGNNPIVSVIATNPYPSGGTTNGSGTLGGTNIDLSTKPAGAGWDTTTGYVGSITGAKKEGDVYSTVGVQGPTDNSNQFGAMQSADLAVNKLAVTSFGLYVFTINADLGPKGNVAVQFNSGALPIGTFIIAYGQTNQLIFDTPFTESGLTTKDGVGGVPSAVPEPSTMLIAAVGALGFLGYSLRRRRKG